ncbi:hypothetical protein TNCV_3087971 [Trichonephila clavipes]|uniref:Uncharacterized protein n=1 Tax=Trichonephila clavipes TaxID=2585209 RepID=A0A8X6RGH8_TRICX|nr:hypothetical protein TNCV_3087971 [Trichonephila clavipes]
MSCTPNSSCDQNQTHFPFFSHLQRSCDMEHICSSNVPGTTAKRRVHYHNPLQSRSACRRVLCFNARLLFNALGNGSQKTPSRPKPSIQLHLP